MRNDVTATAPCEAKTLSAAERDRIAGAWWSATRRPASA